MSTEEKPKPTPESKHTYKSIAAGNNDRVANVVFTIMTGLVFIGSAYLYYHLEDYLALLQTNYPDYEFPKFSDYLVCLIIMPITIVIKYT